MYLKELLSYSNGEVGPGCVQESKNKGAVLLGFIWTDVDDLVLVTDHGIEFYQVCITNFYLISLFISFSYFYQIYFG